MNYQDADWCPVEKAGSATVHRVPSQAVTVGRISPAFTILLVTAKLTKKFKNIFFSLRFFIRVKVEIKKEITPASGTGPAGR
jgi:hypothetical protein